MHTVIRDEIGRRGFLGGLAGVGALGVAGCSSSSGGSDEREATRQITAATGRVEVPADPRRVACLDPGFSWQTLVATGLRPVGLPLVIDTIVQPQNLAAVKGIPTLQDADGGIDVEKVAKVRPDLILANATPELDKTIAQLRAIAPVAAYAFRYPSDWPSLARRYAAAVNREARLAATIARYDQQVAKLKDEHGSVIAAQKWALVTASGGNVFVWGSRSSAGPALAAAGARFSSGAPDAQTPFTQVSLERLDRLDDATVIFYGAGADGTTPYADTAQLLKRPVFTRLPAVRAGRLFPLPSWFAYCYQDAMAQLDGIAAACRKLA